MKALIMLSFVLFCTACSMQPLTEEQKYGRENKETLRIEKYYRDAHACRKGGGMVIIERRTASRFDSDRPLIVACP